MKSDAPTRDIVAALRSAGCTVHYLLSRPGAGQAGMPDLLVGVLGVTYLLEVKTATGVLGPAQIAWHRGWNGGSVVVVRDVSQALTAVGLLKVAA